MDEETLDHGARFLKGECKIFIEGYAIFYATAQRN